jgi:hypothetical protein
MKPLDFGLKQAAFLVFLVTVIFFIDHNLVFLFATLPFLFTLLADRFKSQTETPQQKLISIAILCVFFAVAIPLKWGKSEGYSMVAGFLLGLASFIFHLRRKVIPQPPLSN